MNGDNQALASTAAAAAAAGPSFHLALGANLSQAPSAFNHSLLPSGADLLGALDPAQEELLSLLAQEDDGQDLSLARLPTSTTGCVPGISASSSAQAPAQAGSTASGMLAGAASAAGGAAGGAVNSRRNASPRTGYSKKKVPVVKPAHEFATQTRANALDPAQLDPKRARRIIANRQSAHKSRLKKLTQIHALEKEVEDAAAQAQALQQEADLLEASNSELLRMAQGTRNLAVQLHTQVQQQVVVNAAFRDEFTRLMGQAKDRQQQQQQGGAFAQQQQQEQGGVFEQQQQQQHQQAGTFAQQQQQQGGASVQQHQHQQGGTSSQQQQQQEGLSLQRQQHQHGPASAQQIGVAAAGALPGGGASAIGYTQSVQQAQTAYQVQHGEQRGPRDGGSDATGLRGSEERGVGVGVLGSEEGASGFGGLGGSGLPRIGDALPNIAEEQIPSGPASMATTSAGANLLSQAASFESMHTLSIATPPSSLPNMDVLPMVSPSGSDAVMDSSPLINMPTLTFPGSDLRISSTSYLQHPSIPLPPPLQQQQQGAGAEAGGAPPDGGPGGGGGFGFGLRLSEGSLSTLMDLHQGFDLDLADMGLPRDFYMAMPSLEALRHSALATGATTAAAAAAAAAAVSKGTAMQPAHAMAASAGLEAGSFATFGARGGVAGAGAAAEVQACDGPMAVSSSGTGLMGGASSSGLGVSIGLGQSTTATYGAVGGSGQGLSHHRPVQGIGGSAEGQPPGLGSLEMQGEGLGAAVTAEEQAIEAAGELSPGTQCLLPAHATEMLADILAKGCLDA